MTTPTMEKIKVMLAFDEGKRIQCKIKDSINDPWDFVLAPMWNWHKFDYRVAPPAPRKFTRWFLENPGARFVGPFYDKDTAKTHQYLYVSSRIVAFEMTEILDAS